MVAMRFFGAMMKYKNLEPGSDSDHTPCCFKEDMAVSSVAPMNRRATKIWDWGRAGEQIHQAGGQEGSAP